MKILGIDYGQNKIGVAVGDTETGLVEPLVTVRSKKPELSIKQIAVKEKAKKIIIGIPGGRMDEEIKGFSEGLVRETGLPVEFIDETLTTKDAQKALIASGRNQKDRKEKEDAIAAAIMLEYFMKEESGNV
jgi:putative Holliday junction resolvase